MSDSIRVGITGQAGFIGSYLLNYLKYTKEGVQLVPFEDNFFIDSSKIEAFVINCDVIVHLAAVNRHVNQSEIYDTNIGLVRQLISAMEKTEAKPHILFASSIQEQRDNAFGRSKLEGRKLLCEWSRSNKVPFTGMIIPNVFGPFGRPYNNSVIATFCHQLTHSEQPRVEIDAQLKLIYIDDLVSEIWHAIKYSIDDGEHWVKPTHYASVSELLVLLQGFKNQYFNGGIIPDISNILHRNLFITLISYNDHESFFPIKLKLNTDNRGSFVEAIKLNSGGQVSFSTTKPGVIRGNHFHTRKYERFIVIRGKALIKLRRIGTDRIISFALDGNDPAYVDMPVWYTHNITNIGEEDLYTILWISEFYDENDPDTFFELV